jgi:hypothetical protein
LQKDIQRMQPPAWVVAKLQSALHVIPAPVLRIPCASPEAGMSDSPAGSSGIEAGSTLVDPWYFDGGFMDVTDGRVPHWLKGAIRRRVQD